MELLRDGPCRAVRRASGIPVLRRRPHVKPGAGGMFRSVPTRTKNPMPSALWFVAVPAPAVHRGQAS